mmetsp:Transcript_9638/g.16478  ORF Transcript_9638/g.16478 Transcript_9638/m.16478 type:complete len:325 (-) Transcript_9638:291-1265(-)
MVVLLLRAATMAASFIRLASDAPEKPVVRLATMSRSSSSASGLPRACTLRIARRPLTSGRSTGTRRSKRPGRTRAESSMSARLVAASTMTPELPSKPSISVRIWLSVCSRSSLPPPMPPPPPPARAPPMASISSMKMMAGELASASSKALRRPASLSPERLDITSGPLSVLKYTPHSVFTALAIIVFPEPAGPWMSTPRGGRTPTASKTPGCLSGRSISSCSSPSWRDIPPMSSYPTRSSSKLSSSSLIGSPSVKISVALPTTAAFWSASSSASDESSSSTTFHRMTCASSPSPHGVSKTSPTLSGRSLSARKGLSASSKTSPS